MIKKILSLFGKKNAPIPREYDEEAASRWHDEKSAYMETVLGKEHDMVMHAIIPYAVGGGLDLYYYPNGIEGVGIATKEVSDLPDQGSSNKQFDQYELVMFTRHKLDLDIAKDKSTPFGKAHSNINSILNCIAPYSAQATLNHNETCEFPEDMEGLGGKCLIFQAYGWSGERQNFGLLAVIEVFRSEMQFARESGTASLIERLKEAGYYPYSDLDREPVA